MHGYSKQMSLLAFFLASVFFLTPFCFSGELIAPSRSLQGSGQTAGRLAVASEPPGLDAFLDGSSIGKTPVWLNGVEPGLHKLKVKDSETQIDVLPGKTLQVSLFKGSFIRTVKEEKEVEKQPSSEEDKLTEREKSAQPPEEERNRDLTPWERYINRSSPSF